MRERGRERGREGGQEGGGGREGWREGGMEGGWREERREGQLGRESLSAKWAVSQILRSTVPIHTYRQSIHSPNLFSYCKDIQQGLGRMFPYPIPCIDHWFMGHSASSLGCSWLRVTENYDITVGLHHVDGIWEKTGREGRDKGSGSGEGRGSKWEGRDKGSLVPRLISSYRAREERAW